MLSSIFLFEVRYQLRQWLFWLVTLVFLLLSFFAVITDAVQIGGAIGNVHRNSPFVITQLMINMTVIGMFVITAFVASSVQRDFEYNLHPLFFSKPIRTSDYLIGRFAGALTVSMGVFVGVALGMALGSLWPLLEADQLGPFRLEPYLYAFFVFVVPNVIFMGGLLFALASFSRNLLMPYLGVVFLFVFIGISQIFAADLENRFIAGLLDPFGSEAYNLATRYWTVADKNSAMPSLGEGGLLINRLIWMGVGIAAFQLSLLIFDPARSEWIRRKRNKAVDGGEEALAADAKALPEGLASGSVFDYSRSAHIRQFLRQARLETVGVLKGALFLTLLAFGCLYFTFIPLVLKQLFGTPVYPVTHILLQFFLGGTFIFFLLIIVIFYSGDLVWKEKTLRMNEVYDALPVPSWVTFASKIVALWAVCLIFLTVGALAAIVVQITQGYYHFELGLYLKGTLLQVTYFLLASVLAVFLQVIANNKFVGYLLMILYLISTIVLGVFHFDHNLYQFASRPGRPYSDMNGYGHFLVPFFWFTLYWALFCLALFALSILFRVRGTDRSMKIRLQQAAVRLRGPAGAALAASLLGFAAVGGYIFYNTNVINKYVPGDVQEDRQAEYEKKYRKYKDLAMPRIIGVKTEVDIFPEERRMRAHGVYRMKNKTAKPIDTLHVTLDTKVKLEKLAFRDHELVEKDDVHGYSIYRLKQPLQPGEEMPFEFVVEAQERGFVNGGSDRSLVYNGTFFNNRQYFPSFGFDDSRQLVDRNERKKRGLPPVHRMAKVNDTFARRNNYLANDSDWLDFETTVSTSPDQIAVAPGYLQREWTENGRRYFHYKMDSPILHFYSYLSARYTVKKDRWKDVAIEIYYHEPHGYNVDRMVDSIKKSLDYFTANFGPYQHRQMRVLEFPRYFDFAQAFPNTVPYSEGIGFIADLRDKDAIDYVFYVTAHEVAHQWWAHQVIGGNVQGSTMLSETMAQYSALMVMEKEYGKEKMRRFLKYELDNYLSNRSGELIEEVPLMLVENQPYIHYRKGSLILYGLRDSIGEEALNTALRRYIQAVAFQEPPYTNTPELMKYIEEVTPPDRRSILDDMFRKITLFENRVTNAVYTRRPDGKYDVDLTFEAKKVRADGKGTETPVKLDDWIDVGVFGEKPKKGADPEETVLYLQKHHITQGTNQMKLVVNAPPVRAGVDPYNKLVDRNSDDNRKKVDEGTGAAAAGGR